MSKLFQHLLFVFLCTFSVAFPHDASIPAGKRGSVTIHQAPPAHPAPPPPSHQAPPPPHKFVKGVKPTPRGLMLGARRGPVEHAPTTRTPAAAHAPAVRTATPEKILVLSIDGGGYRGIVAVQILADIERLLFGKRVYQFADVIGGTSVGSIIAAALNTPMNGLNPFTAQEALDFFTGLGKNIFARPLLRTLKTGGGALGAKYSIEPLEAALLHSFGDKTLSDSILPMVLTSFAIEYKQPYDFYSTRPGYEKLLLRNVLRASTAAPVYFAPINLHVPALNPGTPSEEMTLADGGLASTSPQSAALKYARSVYPSSPAKPREYVVISISTGKPIGQQFSVKSTGKTAGGAANMLVPTLKGALDSQIKTSTDDVLYAPDVVDFYRVAVILPKACEALDKPENHACLIDAAQHARAVTKKSVKDMPNGERHYEMVETTFTDLIRKIKAVSSAKSHGGHRLVPKSIGAHPHKEKIAMPRPDKAKELTTPH